MELPRKLINFQNSLNFLKLFRRTCRFDANGYGDDKIVKEENKKKRKLSVTKKYFPKDSRDSPIIVEAKEASTVVKNLNLEFKMLYGPLQSPKSSNTIKKILENNSTIIQNQTVFPILDPKGDSKSAQTVDIDANKDSNEFDFHQTLLKFPLLNEQSRALSSDIEISEINLLRKILEEKSKTYVPSVSRILEKTMPQEQAEILRRWKENMIKQLGEEGFQKYQEEILLKGQTLHTCINNYLASVPRSEVEIEKAIAGHWESLKGIFPSINDIKLLEERITHPFLRYKGVVDCFARYKNNLVVIDWKTSKKKKLTLSSTFDNPLQIAAYVGALNFDPKYQYLANKGLIVVAYEDGSRASAHFMDENVLMRYWKEWLARVKLYWELTEKEESQQS
ncbi:mitochondrial genome maintenance exonuclease 1-like [Argiope bruennichi]|uniref:Mitochondrial genome maintenance exonuclease 1 n=1 Tax=Argiope bruennichi TaxID=94029 RepID=A0A8T0G0N1_ARGBR|nr:mitochondrial genome maintenance exonuclease 1-like [Argiope bruennichi]KAF8796801.1 Mitochondrial genome maintenance exonuclease like protein [Argiope bruennichi]